MKMEMAMLPGSKWSVHQEHGGGVDELSGVIKEQGREGAPRGCHFLSRVPQTSRVPRSLTISQRCRKNKRWNIGSTF